MKKKVLRLAIIISIILGNIFIFNCINFERETMSVQLVVKAEGKDMYQVFYSYGEEFKEQFVNASYARSNEYEKLTFTIPKDIRKIRFDLGSRPGKIYLKEISLNYGGVTRNIPYEKVLNENQVNNISQRTVENNEIILTIDGTDPIIIFDMEELTLPNFEKVNSIISLVLKIVSCILLNLVVGIFIKVYPITKIMLKELYLNRKLIYSLSKNDFKTKYAGSYLGIMWAFVQPVVVITIYWFVFQVGFKSAPMGDFPFLLWLIAGIVPWFFFNEGLMNATNSLIEYSYLVKKVVFKISILPIVKIISALYVHVFFVGFAMIIFVLYGYVPSLHIIQAIYYSFCAFTLILAISYITSSLIIFVKDLGQLVNIALQFGMWVTPIMWNSEMMPQNLQWILKMNPMYYVVEGYRDSFIRHIWFWERYNQTIYFWGVTGCLLIIGMTVFKRTKSHFADVL